MTALRPGLKTIQKTAKKPAQDEDTIKYRLTALIYAVVEESNFDPMIKRVVSKMILNFLGNAREEILKEKIENLRDEIIPFILLGAATKNEQTKNTHTDG